MNLKIGCCGFPVSKQEYYEKFKVVEIQKTFYQLPRVETAKEWRLSAPKDFGFTLKAWQAVTHDATSPTYRKTKLKMSDAQKRNLGFFKPTDEVFSAWDETEKIAAALKAKVIVFQCPPSFEPSTTNKNNLKKFFRSIKRKRYQFAWEPHGTWSQKEIKRVSEELDLVHSADPFKGSMGGGSFRYFRLAGIGGSGDRYKGLDLKKLRDFCENEARQIKRRPIYVFFNNISMMNDALRFQWIAENTGRIKELDLFFLKGLCREIELEEEDEKVQILSREAEKIVSLILHTDYAQVDIEIEKGNLREMCKKFFPDKEYLYEMIYGQRFDRLWEQFRREK